MCEDAYARVRIFTTDLNWVLNIALAFEIRGDTVYCSVLMYATVYDHRLLKYCSAYNFHWIFLAEFPFVRSHFRVNAETLFTKMQQHIQLCRCAIPHAYKCAFVCCVVAMQTHTHTHTLMYAKYLYVCKQNQFEFTCLPVKFKHLKYRVPVYL